MPLTGDRLKVDWDIENWMRIVGVYCGVPLEWAINFLAAGALEDTGGLEDCLGVCLF